MGSMRSRILRGALLCLVSLPASCGDDATIAFTHREAGVDGSTESNGGSGAAGAPGGSSNAGKGGASGSAAGGAGGAGPSGMEAGLPDAAAGATSDAATGIPGADARSTTPADATSDSSPGDASTGLPRDPLECIAARLQALAASGSWDLAVQADCASTPAICCAGGNPVTPCGPLVLDLVKRSSDTTRLVITPASSAMRDDVTIRGRITTPTPIPITVPVVGDCALTLATQPGLRQDIQIDAPVSRVSGANGDYAAIGNITISGLELTDASLGGNLACQTATLGLSFFVGTLTSTFEDDLKSSLCSSCRCTP
jgi:hypothetical protein